MKRASQLRTPTIHQEDVRAFIDKLLRDHQQSCPLLTRYEDTFPFELSHMPLCSPKYSMTICSLASGTLFVERSYALCAVRTLVYRCVDQTTEPRACSLKTARGRSGNPRVHHRDGAHSCRPQHRIQAVGLDTCQSRCSQHVVARASVPWNSKPGYSDHLLPRMVGTVSLVCDTSNFKE